jgi:hypothetical protein
MESVQFAELRLAQRNCSGDDGNCSGQGADEIERQGHGLMHEVCKDVADPY